MADKATQLILNALGRAAAEGGPVPLFGTRSAPGLFPATAAGRQAAQRASDEGYLVCAEAPTLAPAGTAVKAKAESCTITDRGLAWLLEQHSPRQVLEDFVRVLEARARQAEQQTAALRQTHACLDALRAHAGRALDQLQPRPAASLNDRCRDFHSPRPGPDLDDRLLARLAAWPSAQEDYPLPELFRRLAEDSPGLTIGQFHDALRGLQHAGRLYLHPWTGPLYELPEPPFALLVGHEVAYYASPSNGECGMEKGPGTTCHLPGAPLTR